IPHTCINDSEWLSCLKTTERLIERMGHEKIGAIIIEPILGEGGYVVPPKDFIQGLRDLCTAKGIFLIFDEVQTGFGRTGKMFAAEHFDVEPDIMTVAKGIASGFPISALIAKSEIMDQWPAGSHGNTFTGNPVSCAAALATIDVIEKEKLLNNTVKRGAELISALHKLSRKYPVIGDVRGKGLMIGVEIVKPEESGTGAPDPEMTKKIMGEALKDGLILISCGISDNVIRIVPPLNVSKEEVKKGLKIFETVLSRV
ncbi:MAG: aminotransferase class III-fold pyridoxal phosphate-dependent enzyme, partial [bacterium]